MRAIVCDAVGGPEVLRLAEVPDPVPGDGEILVRVHAAGVNRADVLQRLGKYEPPPGASPILGLEVAGEVVALGPGCTRFAAGDRVMAIVTGGGYAELAAAPEVAALPVPDGLGWPEAGAIPEVFLTAWLNLFDLGQLATGETVIVHAGASGVGTAAIQLAQDAGAHVVATAGSDAKLDLCRRLGAERVVSRHRDDFVRVAREMTAGKGADLVVDFVGAPYWKRNLDALRFGGRLVLIGFLGGSSGEIDLAPLLRKSLTVRSTTLRGTPLERKAQLVRDFAERALPLFATRRLRPVLDRTFPLAEAAAAHHHMQSNLTRGKLVLLPG